MPEVNASSEDVVLVASVEEMAKTLPCRDARKRILATDALASVDGFRTMVQLTFQHLWGMCFCKTIAQFATLRQRLVKICLAAMQHQREAF